jgi:hypothetical protein
MRNWLWAMMVFLYSGLHAGCCIGPSLYIGAEGLWWTVYQEDLEFAVDVSSNDENILVGPGKTHSLDYGWRGGARGFIGFDGYCGWDIRGVYTWYKADPFSHVTHDNDEQLLLASWAHPGGVGFEAEIATASQHFTYQTADLLFAREVTFSCLAFTLEPFVGVRGLRLKQKVSVDYEGADFIENPQQINFESDLKAIGLLVGLHMRNNIFCGLGLYGDLAASALYGKSDFKQNQLSLNTLGEVVDTVVDFEDENHGRVLPGCHLRAGMDWLIETSCFFVHIQAGYEFNHWFNTPAVTRFFDDVNHGVSSSSRKGELTLHGATLSLSIRF